MLEDPTNALSAPSGGDAAAPPADEVWRLFVALEIPEALRAQLRRVQERLRRTGARVGWTPPQNLHLTLVFLGDTFAGRVPALAAALDGAARAVPPFAFDVATLGFYGPPRSPRVVWAGVPAPPPELAALQARAAAAVAACGAILEKRPFCAHVTLGRVRPGGGAAALTSALESLNNTFGGRVPVTRALLLRSVLGPAGPQYTVIHESKLTGD